MEPEATARKLEEWALDAGFDRAGVARLEPSEQGGALAAWLARGDHAGMAWIERRTEPRLDPRELLPGARSALCVALRYAPLAGQEEPDEPRGRHPALCQIRFAHLPVQAE
jgi:epoxyqueuosine reductase